MASIKDHGRGGGMMENIMTYSTGETYLEFTETEAGVEVLIEKVEGYGSNHAPTDSQWKGIAQDLAEAIYEMRQPSKGMMSLKHSSTQKDSYKPVRFSHPSSERASRLSSHIDGLMPPKLSEFK